MNERMHVTYKGRRVWLNNHGKTVRAECGRCGEVFEGDAFRDHPNTIGGKQSYCGGCDVIESRKRQIRRTERNRQARQALLNRYAGEGLTGYKLTGGRVAYANSVGAYVRLLCLRCDAVQTVEGGRLVCDECADKK